MPLQNRVMPDGGIVAIPQRGMFMGNRGGSFHDPQTRTLRGGRHWANRQWICCALSFKGRHRKLMAPNTYTELFFLDEVTALAAGHRPCFECRRKDAVAFAEVWQAGIGCTGRMRAKEMDAILHLERASAHPHQPELRRFAELADGCVVSDGAGWLAKENGRALRWSADGYSLAMPPSGEVELITPPSIERHVLAGGYAPVWHPSVNTV